MTILQGLVLYNGHLQTEKFRDYIDWFKQRAEDRGMKIQRTANTELLVKLGRCRDLAHVFDDAPSPDFIHMADKDLFLARQLEHLRIPLYNGSHAINVCDDKRLMHERLTDWNIPQPTTVIAPMIYSGMRLTQIDYLKEVAAQLGFPLVVKEAFGSFGEQVHLVETAKQLHETARHLSAKPHIYQQFIKESAGEDRRLNVIGDRVVAAMYRSSASDFRANVTSGGNAEPYTPSYEETTLALSAAKAVGADFAGVDLLMTQNGPVVCEVNSNPHIRSIYECTGIDVAVPMLEWIEATYKRKGEQV